MDGELVKTWEVHCFLCERPLLGVGRHGSKDDAAEEARRHGWRTRMGRWVCPDDAADPHARHRVVRKVTHNKEGEADGR